MQGTGAGWDSRFYRVFVVGGLLAVVAGVVGSVILTPGSVIHALKGLRKAKRWQRLEVRGDAN